MIKNNSLIFGSTGFIGTKVVAYLKNFEDSTIAISRKKNPDFGSLVDQIMTYDECIYNRYPQVTIKLLWDFIKLSIILSKNGIFAGIPFRDLKEL